MDGGGFLVVVFDPQKTSNALVKLFLCHSIYIADPRGLVNTEVEIYVIASGPCAVKIGYSADPKRRLRQLQTGHEEKLQLIHTEQVEPDQAPILEKLIHRANNHRRRRGEWFNLTHEEAIAELQHAIIYYSDDLPTFRNTH
jgi:hypothetical protein